MNFNFLQDNSGRPTRYVNGKRYDLRYCTLIIDLAEIPEDELKKALENERDPMGWGVDTAPKNRTRIFQSRGLQFLKEFTPVGKEPAYSIITEEEAKRFCLDHPAAIITDGYDRVFGKPIDG